MPEVQRPTFDLESITLGEMVDVELESGQDFNRLLSSKRGRYMIAAYLLLKRHGKPIEWSELANRRPLASSSSDAPSPSDSPSETPAN